MADIDPAERELMRQKITDILMHRRYQNTDEGPAQFVGMRQVDDEMLALLKRDEQIVVLPIDAATARRMKRLSIGEVVKVTSQGVIVKAGRSR